MAKISRRQVFDAGKEIVNNRVKPVVFIYRGKVCQEQRPLGKPSIGGKVERWVDLQGNVVSLQLLSPGVPYSNDLIDKARGKYRRQGFIEYHLCPLTSGAHRIDKVKTDLEDAPVELRVPCESDPVIAVRDKGYWVLNDPCPHVQYLMEVRKQRHAEHQARRAREPNRVELERKRLEMLEQQNAKLAELAFAALGDKAEKGRKGKREQDPVE